MGATQLVNLQADVVLLLAKVNNLELTISTVG